MTGAGLRRNGLGMLGLALGGLAVLAAVAAPLLAPHDPVKGDFSQGLKPPGTPGHPLARTSSAATRSRASSTEPASRSSSGSAPCC